VIYPIDTGNAVRIATVQTDRHGRARQFRQVGLEVSIEKKKSSDGLGTKVREISKRRNTDDSYRRATYTA
jgi:hypothetical protein